MQKLTCVASLYDELEWKAVARKMTTHFPLLSAAKQKLITTGSHKGIELTVPDVYALFIGINKKDVFLAELQLLGDFGLHSDHRVDVNVTGSNIVDCIKGVIVKGRNLVKAYTRIAAQDYKEQQRLFGIALKALEQ